MAEHRERDAPPAPEQVNAVSEKLNSQVPSLFFSGLDGLDTASFVDCYLLNEIMENYPGRHAPFRMYRSANGKLAIEPDWDFSAAFDNTREPMSRDEATTARYLCFDRLLMSSGFLADLEARYYRLVRMKIIGGDNLYAVMDDIAARLGPAMDRDWRRWSHVYTTDSAFALLPETTAREGAPRLRQTHSHEQEFLKIKRRLVTGDYAIRNHLSAIKWTPGLFTPAMNASANAFYTVVFVVIFLLVVIYARNRV